MRRLAREHGLVWWSLAIAVFVVLAFAAGLVWHEAGQPDLPQGVGLFVAVLSAVASVAAVDCWSSQRERATNKLRNEPRPGQFRASRRKQAERWLEAHDRTTSALMLLVAYVVTALLFTVAGWQFDAGKGRGSRFVLVWFLCCVPVVFGMWWLLSRPVRGRRRHR